jgi:hypothetical protein
MERLLVDAKRLGITRHDVHRAVDARWTDLFGPADDE